MREIKCWQSFCLASSHDTIHCLILHSAKSTYSLCACWPVTWFLLHQADWFYSRLCFDQVLDGFSPNCFQQVRSAGKHIFILSSLLEVLPQ